MPESVFFRPSGDAYARLDADPEDRGNDLALRFSATMQCDFRACQETAAVAGDGEEKSTFEFGHRELYVVLSPRFVNPSPHLFPIPSATPARIAALIKTAFVLSWGDYEACLNRVRICIESLLDVLRIRRFATNKGRRTPLTLHRRVELAQPQVASAKPFLMAAKYLGNAGSHGNRVKRSDVFDAFDLLEAVIADQFGGRKAVTQLALKIVKSRGPLKRNP